MACDISFPFWKIKDKNDQLIGCMVIIFSDNRFKLIFDSVSNLLEAQKRACDQFLKIGAVVSLYEKNKFNYNIDYAISLFEKEMISEE